MQTPLSRRRFVAGLSAAAVGAAVAPALAQQNLLSAGQAAWMTQRALPYAVDALEPVIDTETMRLHFGKHHAGYVRNAIKAWGDRPAQTSLPAVLQTMDEKTSAALRNNVGGHANHTLFWDIMAAPGTHPLSAETALEAALTTQFGSLEAFKTAFRAASLSVFGSGWVWLCVEKPTGRLFITTTSNQDSPLMAQLAKEPGIPILALDVWEHAYYLRYQNRRAAYVDAWWQVVNWSAVARHWQEAAQA